MALKTCKTVEKAAIASEQFADGRSSCFQESTRKTNALLRLQLVWDRD